MEKLNAFLTQWESFWLFTILLTEMVVGISTLYILIKEYRYDEAKDLAKKQKRTKTTKKVTESKDGQKIVEETTETSEPMQGEQK
jgi:hypothetical protein